MTDQGDETFSLATPIDSVQRADIPPSVVPRSEPPMDAPGEEWHIRLRDLQGLICELLIKNQRLRAALIEATSARPVESQPSALQASSSL